MNDVESDHEADSGHVNTADPTENPEEERCDQKEVETTETVTEGVLEGAETTEAEIMEENEDVVPENIDHK